MGAARTMFDGKRYIYAVFMCHLSIEKALKGLYYKERSVQAPKTHNLWFLVDEIGLQLPDSMAEFVVALNRQSVVTRYPEELGKVGKIYNKKTTKAIMEQSAEVLRWLQEKL